MNLREERKLSGLHVGMQSGTYETNWEQSERKQLIAISDVQAAFLAALETQQVHYNIYLRAVAVGFKVIFLRYLQIIPALFK